MAKPGLKVGDLITIQGVMKKAQSGQSRKGREIVNGKYADTGKRTKAQAYVEQTFTVVLRAKSRKASKLW